MDFICDGCTLIAGSSAALTDWLQAAGSLLAIPVAVYISVKAASVARSDARDRAVEQDQLLLDACVALGRHANLAMKSASKKIVEGESPIRTERLVDIQQSLRIIMGKSVPMVALNALLEIQCEIAYQIAAINLINDERVTPSANPKRSLVRKNKVFRSYKYLKEISNQYRAKSPPIERKVVSGWTRPR